MKPNQGTVAGGYRLLVSSASTGKQRWYWWLVSLVTELQGDAERREHEVRVLSVSTQTVLAMRSFDRELQAKRAREGFVELVESGVVTSMEPGEVQAALDSVVVN